MKQIGERIYQSREKCGLSQQEFAEILEVSRQSVSKWETGTAIPELTKLIKMADIFGISLDMLILGKESEEIPNAQGKMRDTSDPDPKPNAQTPIPEKNLTKTVIGACFLGVGILLSIFFMLWAPLFGVFLLIPFGFCAFFCLKQFRCAALWCSETWFVAMGLYLNYGTGTSWKLVFSPYLYLPTTNEWKVILSFTEFVLLAVFVAMTVLTFRHHSFDYSKKKNIAIAVTGGAVLVLATCFGNLFELFCFHILCNGDKIQYSQWLGQMDHYDLLIVFAVDLMLVAAFTACLIPTVAWIKSSVCKISKQKNQ